MVLLRLELWEGHMSVYHRGAIWRLKHSSIAWVVVYSVRWGFDEYHPWKGHTPIIKKFKLDGPTSQRACRKAAINIADSP